MTKKRLVILDVDETLMGVFSNTELTLEEVASRYPGTLAHDDNNFICPRPYLDHFLNWLIDNQNIEIAIFSAALRQYLDVTIFRLKPDLLNHCLFVWDRESPNYSGSSHPRKFLTSIPRQYGYALEDVIMIDDSETIIPLECGLDIIGFNPEYHCRWNKEDNDNELIRTLLRLEKLLVLDDIHKQKDIDKVMLKEANDEHMKWVNEQGLSLFDGSFHEREHLSPVVHPSPCDYVKDKEVDRYISDHCLV